MQDKSYFISSEPVIVEAKYQCVKLAPGKGEMN